MTTRFNDATWDENVKFRRKNDVACVYCSPSPLPIPLNSVMYVIEMNNSTNLIEGIGITKNLCRLDIRLNVYEQRDLNCNVFTGTYRIGRDELLTANAALLEIIEEVLFVGKSHYKRGRSITTVGKKFFLKIQSMSEILQSIDVRIIESNMKRMIKDIFRSKYNNQS